MSVPDDPRAASFHDGPRIVSLLPSATEIVAALGLAGALVGRSHECDFPEGVERLPICTEPMIDPGAPSDEIHRSVSDLLARKYISTETSLRHRRKHSASTACSIF